MTTALETVANTFSWTTVFLSMTVSILIISSLVKRAKFLYALRNIPSPGGALPLLGNAKQLNCSLEDFFKQLMQWSKELGDIYLVWVGTRPFIFLYRAKFVQPLLNSSQHIHKSLEYQFLKPWLRDGLITSTGSKWHARRKLLSPIFHSGLLRDYFKVTTREARVFSWCLRTELGRFEGFDVMPYAKRAALDIICECAMGHNIHTQTNFENEYHRAVQDLTTICQKRFTNIWIASDFVFKRTALGKQHDRCLEIIHGFVARIISERKLARSREREANANQQTPINSRTLLDTLLDRAENGEQLTDEDILEEVHTFMFAGHDTVATSVSWALYALGRRPEYQDKIVEEYNELFKDGQDVGYDELHKLTWLEACVRETWRIYPVSPLIARQIYTPLNLDGYEIPAGATVLVNSFMLHRDPQHFPDPETYLPERFLPEAEKPLTFAYVPFSAGSRNCVGWKFAVLETKLTLLRLLRDFRFHSLEREDQLRFVSQLVLDNVGGIRLSITERR